MTMMSAFARGLRQFRFDFPRYGIAGIALTLGVALVFGTLLTSKAFNDQLTRGVGSLNGIADVAVVPAIPGTTVPESTVEQIAKLANVETTIPTLARNTSLRSSTSAESEQRLTLTGYPTSLNAVLMMGLDVRGRAPAADKPEALVPEDVATRLGVRINDFLTASSSEGATKLQVVGIFDGRRLGPLAYDNIFVDLQYVQRIFSLPGQISRVDIRLHPGHSAADWQTDNVGSLPRVLKVQDTSVLSSTFGPLLTVVSIILMVASGTVLGIAILLSATAFRMVVAARQPAYGILRTVGAQGRWLATSVLFESLILALACSIVGVAAGYGVSLLLNQVLSSVGNLPGGTIAAEPWQIVIAVSSGVLASMAGASASILKVLRQVPMAAISPENAERRRRQTLRSILGFLLLAFGAATYMLHAAAAKWLGVVVSLGASGLLAPQVLMALVRLKFHPEWTGKAAASRLRRHASLDSTVTVTAMVVCLGTALVIGVSSVRSAMVEQIDRQFGADIQISSATAMTGKLDAKLSSVPGIQKISETVWDYGAIDFAGKTGQVGILAVDPTSYFDTAQLPWRQGNDVSSPTALKDGGSIIFPEALAASREISVGDRVQLSRAGKAVTLRVVATFASLATGTQVVVDRDTASALGLIGFNGWNIEAKPGVDIASLRDAISAVTADIPGTTVITAEKMRQRSESELGSYARAAFGVVVIALGLGAIGSAGLFSVAVVRREKEFGMLRAVGATRGNITKLVVYEAILTGTAASLSGLLIGQLSGWILTQIVAETLGATLQPSFGISACIGILATTLTSLCLAALGPAIRSSRVEPATALRTE
ncbi:MULTISPECIES: FtsX-like permease family protein [Arthrobacter]|nr:MULTISPECIES: FtsX-like permease family protein [Arthrobacter]MBT8158835.1 ABC transporter permease [Arthrobacter sp. GN70]